jgi:hypothetical protein
MCSVPPPSTRRLASSVAKFTIAVTGVGIVAMSAGAQEAAPVAPVVFRLGEAGMDYGKDMTTDPWGNLVVAGYFAGTVDFDPGEGQAAHTASGIVDTFVAKYDPRGRHLWSIGAGGAAADIPHTVRTDAAGNVIVAGYFSGASDFDPGPGTARLISNGSRDAYVAKYGADGDFRWAVGIGGSGDDEAFDVGLGAAGEVYATGIFTGTVDLDPGSDTRAATSAGEEDIWLLALDADGATRWVGAIGGPGSDHGHAVRASEGQVYVAGFFSDEVDFDPGPGRATQTSRGGWDVFLACYTTGGALVWSTSVGGPGADQVRPGGMELAADGGTVLGGDFAGTVDFDPGRATSDLTSAGAGDIFVAAYGADGSYRQVLGVGGPQGDAAHRLALDPKGNVYVTGWFRGTADFDPTGGRTTVTAESTGGASDIFLASYDPLGQLRWVDGFGAPVTGAENNALGGGIGLDAAAEALSLTGRFYGTVDFDPGSTERELASAGSSDAFVAKLRLEDGSLWNPATTPTASVTPTRTPAPPTPTHLPATATPTQRPRPPTPTAAATLSPTADSPGDRAYLPWANKP